MTASIATDQPTAKLNSANISRDILEPFVNIQDQGIQAYPWLDIQEVSLELGTQQELQRIAARLLNSDTHLMNEATIWSRAIYPLLTLVEKGNIQAWAQVNLKATYPRFMIEAIADGVLGRSSSGSIDLTYLIVVEAKRGLEAQNPVYQLYTQLLAASWLNWQRNPLEPQIIFGAYTIADTWKLMRGEVTGFESDCPVLKIQPSREFIEKLEAEILVKILQKIVQSVPCES